MFDKWFGVQAHKALHFIGALILVVGIPMNKVLMSTGTIWLSANFLINADFKTYWQNIKQNKIAFSIIAILAVHFLGVFYSSNLDYIGQDLNRKLPFFVLPLVLIAYPVHKTFFKDLIHAFLASLVITSVANLLNYQLNTEQIHDIREMSQFGSHIRYGVLIVFGAFISLYYGIKFNNKTAWIYLLLFLYFTYYTVFSQVITAYINYALLLFAFILIAVKSLRNSWLKKALFFVTVLSALLIGLYLLSFLTPDKPTYIKVEELDKKTAEGSTYLHYGDYHYLENGTPVMLYISEKELKREWEKVSDLDFHGVDARNQALKGTLIRYMASKGLRKDAAAFQSLSHSDIKNIENGIATINELEGGLLFRLQGLKFEIQNYMMGEDPSGHSLLQRFEHWRAAIHIIKNNLFFGVGTGDVEQAYEVAYEEINSPLKKDYRNRAHNQFLAFGVAFGILGVLLLVAFSGLLFYKSLKLKGTILIFFSMLVFFSFLPEDTIETQQGATFIGFFTGLLFSRANASHIKVGGKFL